MPVRRAQQRRRPARQRQLPPAQHRRPPQPLVVDPIHRYDVDPPRPQHVPARHQRHMPPVLDHDPRLPAARPGPEGRRPDGWLTIVVPATVRRRVPLLLRHRVADRKSTRLNSSHITISYAVFCLKKKKKKQNKKDIEKKKKKINKK